MRKAISLGLAAGLAGLIATTVVAGTVVGTPRNDVLRGTPKGDRIHGKGGNDKLYGLAGNDVLIGGAGNDLLVGGPGRDAFRCGTGRDVVTGDAQDARLAADCEVVKGLRKSAISIRDASTAEGYSGTTVLSFVVELSAGGQPVSVDFATADGTATAPSDYQPASGTISFGAGETIKTIDVSVVADTAVEPDETLSVTLANRVGATIARGTATGTIQNDDPPRALPGHYEGRTTQNARIAFDVTPELFLERLIISEVDESCTPSFDLRVLLDFGGGRDLAPITADGTFTIDLSLQGTVGSSPTIGRITISGRFSGETASGSLFATTEFVSSGTAYSCTSGQLSWTAGRNA